MASFTEKRREKFGQILLETVGRGNVAELEELLKNKKYDLDYSRRVRPFSETHENVEHKTLEEELGYYLEENALEYASRMGNTDMMKYLIEKGLTFNKRNMQILEHTTYEKDAEVLRLLFNHQMIGSKEAAKRAMDIVFRKIERGGDIPPNNNIMLELIKSPSFSLKDVDCVDFLKAAFMAGVADEVLKRGDLVLDEDGKEELLQVAVEYGSPSEIQMVVDRADIDLNDLNYTNAQTPLYGDNAVLIDTLMGRTSNDPEYNQTIIDLLNNRSMSLEDNGLYLLTKALDLGDTRIFEMLANRADVFMNVIKFGDDDLAQRLLNRDGLKLDPEVLLAAVKNDKISPETIHDILSHDNFEADRELIKKSAHIAGREGNFDAVKEIVDHYHSEHAPLETVQNGDLFNTCVTTAAQHTENEEEVAKFREVVGYFAENPDYDPNKDEFFEDTTSLVAFDREAFSKIMHIDGIKQAYALIKNALKEGYEDFVEELIERDDLVLGSKFDELLSQVDDRFKAAESIRQKLSERHTKEQKELEERQYGERQLGESEMSI